MVAIALAGFAAQPVQAAPKESKKGAENAASNARKGTPPSHSARASREIAARREGTPTQAVQRKSVPERPPQVARQELIRTPDARRTTPTYTNRSTATRSFDNDGRDDARRSWERRDRDNDRRDWDPDRRRSWERYRYFRAPSTVYRNWDSNRI